MKDLDKKLFECKLYNDLFESIDNDIVLNNELRRNKSKEW